MAHQADAFQEYDARQQISSMRLKSCKLQVLNSKILEFKFKFIVLREPMSSRCHALKYNVSSDIDRFLCQTSLRCTVHIWHLQ